jgi:5'-3' exonuclease
MELYPDYKAGRQPTEPTEEELLEKREYYSQMDAVIRGLSYAGIRQVRVPGVEADDLISIYAKFYEEQGGDVIIYTGDHDYHQLVSDRIQVLHPDKGLLDVPAVLELWNLPFIHLIPIRKAMTGKSREVAGVPGLGPKRASLIAPYQHLILTHTDRPTGVPDNVWKWIEKARSHQDIIMRNLKLVVLPHSFQQSFYDRDQAEQAVRQVRGEDMIRSMRKFIEFCRHWELVSVLENIHYW